MSVVLDVTFHIDETGEDLVLDATGLPTLMHVAIENDISAIEGECGGDMTCGTCHVYVEQMPAGYVAEQSADEIDMLEVVDAPTTASRLACQLPVDAHVAGLRLRVPAP